MSRGRPVASSHRIGDQIIAWVVANTTLVNSADMAHSTLQFQITDSRLQRVTYNVSQIAGKEFWVMDTTGRDSPDARLDISARVCYNTITVT